MNESTSIAQLLRDGLAALRAGDRITARQHLTAVVEQDQYHEQAWYWLSMVVETDEERLVCVNNVLTINPGHELAQKRLVELESDTSEPASLMYEVLTSSPISEPVTPDSSASSDAWRAAIFEKYERDTGISAHADRLPRPPFSDLFWAWISAIILRRSPDYRAELDRADIRHTGINLVMIVLLNVVFTLLLAITLMIVNQGFANLVEPAAVTLEQIGETDTSFLIPVPFRGAVYTANVVWGALTARPFDRLFTWIGQRGEWLRQLADRVQNLFLVLMLTYSAILVLWTLVWQGFRGALNDVVSRWLLRGSGDIFQTFHSLTTAQVAYLMAQIPFALIIPFVPLQLTLRIIGALMVYRILLAATALSTVHKRSLIIAALGLLLSGGIMHIIASVLMSGLLRLFLSQPLV